MKTNNCFSRIESIIGRGRFIRSLLILFASVIFCGALSAFSQTMDISVTYGYQNTAKAGRFLPLTIDLVNNAEQTYSGTIHVYLVETEDSIYEYQYQKTVEGASSSRMKVMISLSSGVNQLLVTAEDMNGIVQGSRRIGLDVSGSDAELIIGLVSEDMHNLSYLNGHSLHDGLLRSRTVELDPAAFPTETAELDQLDVLLFTGFEMQRISDSQAAAIRRWVDQGGTLVIGTGALKEDALGTHFSGLIKNRLEPVWTDIFKLRENDGRDRGNIRVSPVIMNGGIELERIGGIPVVSMAAYGAGRIVVSGFDFCDLSRFAAEESDVIDSLFVAMLGERKLLSLSRSATEKTLQQYWDIEALMNMSDLKKLPRPWIIGFILTVYVLLIGPLLYFYIRNHHIVSLYRPSILLTSILVTVLIWVIGYETRFDGIFLTYIKYKDVSKESITEQDFINLRSSYTGLFSMDVRPEYYAYPVLKGADYNGDIQELMKHGERECTSIINGRGKTRIQMESREPFSAGYFELTTKTPNSGGSFVSALNYTDGVLSGTITNETEDTLNDAALLLFGKVIRLGRLEPGQSVEISEREMIHVPVGETARIARTVTQGTGQRFLKYYLDNQMSGYYAGARLVGFVRDDNLGFTDAQGLSSYGITMIVSAIPLSTKDEEIFSFSALSTDPRILSGDYDISGNTITGNLPTTLEYHLGADNHIATITIDSMSTEAGNPDDGIETVVPFRGTLRFLNRDTGAFDIIDIGTGTLTQQQLQRYLTDDNTLTVRYTASERNNSANIRLYLPTMTITARQAASIQGNETAGLTGLIGSVVMDSETVPAEQGDDHAENE